MRRLLIWLGLKKRPLPPERKAELVAKWIRVPEEYLEDLPNFQEELNRFLLKEGYLNLGAYHYPKELFGIDPDIETD